MKQDCLRGHSRRSFVTSVVGLCGGSVLLAQDSVRSQDNSPTFSSSVKVVNLFATVRDKDGKIVSNLTKDDFELSEDGRPQTIKYFAPQTDLPLTLGLLVDTSGSERRNIPTEKDATYKFIEKVMRPDRDKAFLIHFDREVELLQDLTSSRAKLERALELLQSSQPQQQAGNGDPNDPNDPNSGGGQNGGGYPRGGGGGGTWGGGGIGFPGGGGMGYPGGGGGRRGGGGGGQRRQSFHGGTAFYDAIYLASDDVLKTQKGRKAIIMLTDGEDNGSKETISSAIDSAQRADVLGYAIHIADSQANSGFSMGGRGGYPRGGQQDRPDGKKVLKQISKATGGSYFEFKKSLDDIYQQIDEELRNQYSIGYTPDRKDGEGEFHKIELTVKKKGLIVQSRDGYYS